MIHTQKKQIAKAILSTKNKVEVHMPPDFKISYRAIVVNAS